MGITMKVPRISLCMIVRDEEKHLDKCLSSVTSFVNEIIIVDTGSLDHSKDIAERFNSKVFYFTWTDDFSAARNFGLQKACGDWILVLDADEYLEPSTADKILELTTHPAAADAFLLPIKNLMIPEFEEWQISLVLRLFKNDPNLRFQGKIHEQIIIPKNTKVAWSEKGPNIIHLGYTGDRRLQKSRRNMNMLQEAISKEPNQPYYHYYLSTEYITQRDYEKGLKHIRQALAGIPSDVILFRVAAIRNAVLCLIELKKPAEAEELIKLEIATFDKFPDFYFYLGNIYRAKGEHLKAIENYNIALSIQEPSLIGCSVSGANGFKSLFYRGLCQENLRRYFEAIDSFRAALTENPAFFLPLANLINCLLIVGSISECLKYLSGNFNIVAPQLILLVAQLLFAGGYPKEAHKYVNQTDDLDTADEKYILLAEIALTQDKTQEAIAYLTAIPERSPLFPSALIFRCLCAWKLQIPLDKKIFRQLANHEPNRPLVKILKTFDALLSGKKSTAYLIKNSNDLSVCLQFSQELFRKLMECKIYRPAYIISNWIIGIKPELKWELLYYFIKTGNSDYSSANFALSPDHPDYYLEAAKIYEKLALEFLQKVPVLPESGG